MAYTVITINPLLSPKPACHLKTSSRGFQSSRDSFKRTKQVAIGRRDPSILILPEEITVKSQPVLSFTSVTEQKKQHSHELFLLKYTNMWNSSIIIPYIYLQISAVWFHPVQFLCNVQHFLQLSLPQISSP